MGPYQLCYHQLLSVYFSMQLISLLPFLVGPIGILAKLTWSCADIHLLCGAVLKFPTPMLGYADSRSCDLGNSAGPVESVAWEGGRGDLWKHSKSYPGGESPLSEAATYFSGIDLHGLKGF